MKAGVGFVDFIVEVQNWELVEIDSCCFDFCYASDYTMVGFMFLLVLNSMKGRTNPKSFIYNMFPYLYYFSYIVASLNQKLFFFFLCQVSRTTKEAFVVDAI